MAINKKEQIVREHVRREILSVLKESGPTKQFKKAAEELYDAELKQQKIKDKFLKAKTSTEKQMLKQELIAQHKLVQIAQQKFNNILMIEPADDLEESVIREGLSAEQKMVETFLKKIAKEFDYSVADAARFVKDTISKMNLKESVKKKV